MAEVITEPPYGINPAEVIQTLKNFSALFDTSATDIIVDAAKLTRFGRLVTPFFITLKSKRLTPKLKRFLQYAYPQEINAEVWENGMLPYDTLQKVINTVEVLATLEPLTKVSTES
jgi:hypothetical protein